MLQNHISPHTVGKYKKIFNLYFTNLKKIFLWTVLNFVRINSENFFYECSIAFIKLKLTRIKFKRLLNMCNL